MAHHLYLFFTRETLPRPGAHAIQVVQCASAAASLGYDAWLAYPDWGAAAALPWRWIQPRSQRPGPKFVEFYNLQSDLRLLPLAQPWPIDRIQHKLTNSSTMVCKYYWPLFLAPRTRLVHSRNWNFVKAAIQLGVPVVYECHHFQGKPYEPEVVNSPLLQVAVTVVETVRANMIQNGMPKEKIAVIPNGVNPQFLVPHTDQAAQWRGQLLQNCYRQLVVYAGALYSFKGVDLLLEVARQLPQVKFAIAGGPPEQEQHYRALVSQQGLENVELLGFLSQTELAAVLQAADALAHPHLQGEAATFTSPLKLFDYMASGTPIVASKIPSLIDLQRSGAIAAWCEPDHPGEFAQALAGVLEAYPWQPTGYLEGRDYVRPFTWENRIQRILDHVEPRFRPQKTRPQRTAPQRTTNA